MHKQHHCVLQLALQLAVLTGWLKPYLHALTLQ